MLAGNRDRGVFLEGIGHADQSFELPLRGSSWKLGYFGFVEHQSILLALIM